MFEAFQREIDKLNPAQVLLRKANGFKSALFFFGCSEKRASAKQQTAEQAFKGKNIASARFIHYYIHTENFFTAVKLQNMETEKSA